MRSVVGLPDLEEIFLTHYHADHYLGLPGMLKTFSLRQRERRSRCTGRPGCASCSATLRRDLRETVVPGRPRRGAAGRGARARRVPDPRLPGRTTASRRSATRSSRTTRPGPLRRRGGRRPRRPAGPERGALQRGESITLADGRVRHPDGSSVRRGRGRRIVLTGDTAPVETVRVLAEGADVLVHEATFSRGRARPRRRHAALDGRQAAELARDAGVRLLALTHVSPRYFGPRAAAEAQEVFAATVVPRDFDVIEMPFAERGEPHLVRQGARPPRGEPRESVRAARLPPRGPAPRCLRASMPVTVTSSLPIMKSMWIALVLMRSRSSSSTATAYALPNARWLAAFSSSSVLKNIVPVLPMRPAPSTSASSPRREAPSSFAQRARSASAPDSASIARRGPPRTHPSPLTSVPPMSSGFVERTTPSARSRIGCREDLLGGEVRVVVHPVDRRRPGPSFANREVGRSPTVSRYPGRRSGARRSGPRRAAPGLVQLGEPRRARPPPGRARRTAGRRGAPPTSAASAASSSSSGWTTRAQAGVAQGTTVQFVVFALITSRCSGSDGSWSRPALTGSTSARTRAVSSARSRSARRAPRRARASASVPRRDELERVRRALRVRIRFTYGSKYQGSTNTRRARNTRRRPLARAAPTPARRSRAPAGPAARSRRPRRSARA